LKIFINTEIIEGSWGGGNQAIKIISEHLLSLNHEVTFRLKGKVDLIFMVKPTGPFKFRSYSIEEIRRYIVIHPDSILVHRVNTSGEFHRGKGNETDVISEANKFADYTVFISDYLRDLYIHNKGFMKERPHCVILNGADDRIFYPNGRAEFRREKKLRIVTHHWSDNYMKGFDIYERLDLLLETKPFKDLFEFTIIGRIPKGLKFKNTRICPLLYGSELSEALKQNHIYITASRNEGAGMHHIEGMLCGLPVLFINSGALPEYCSPYGIEFNLINFEEKLLEMKELYPILREKVLDCKITGRKMASHYSVLFEKLKANRSKNPKPRPGLEEILKQYLILDQSRKARKIKKILQKSMNYFR